MLSFAQAAAETAQAIACDDSHGYSQPNRQGDGSVTRYRLTDGSMVEMHGGDYDCSSLVVACYIAAGLIAPGTYMWTGNENKILADYGFVRQEFSPYDLQTGDVLWKSGHTGIYVGNGRMVDAHGDEYHGIDGPNPGDQTGAEIEERSVFACSWLYSYRYAGRKVREGSDTDVTGGGDFMVPTVFKFKYDTNIRDAPNGAIIGSGADGYQVGECVTIDELAYANGVVWGGYTGGSGKRRFVAIGHTDRVTQQ